MYRFAASPTSDMHISNLRVALFNYLCAKQKNDRFIVRIEDTGKEKNNKENEQKIVDILKLFGIEYDTLYYQSNNLKFHRQFAVTLLMQKKAFSCFCTEEILETKHQYANARGEIYCYDGQCETLSDMEILNNESPFVIRLKRPKDTFTFLDHFQGEFHIEPPVIDDFVIMHHDKYPTQVFARATDDMLQGITHIIREEKDIANTPKEESIRAFIGYDQTITYMHLPSVVNKIGQNDDALSVTQLLNEGFLPSAIVNYLLRLGQDTPTEIFTIEEALPWFDLQNISRSPVEFDLDTLRYINREHIKQMDDLRLSTLVGFADAGIGKLAKVYTQEVSTLAEIKAKIDGIFKTKEISPVVAKEFTNIKKAAQEAPYFEAFNDYKAHLLQTTGLKEKTFSQSLRLLLTGFEHGPELDELYPHLKHYLKEILR